MLSETNLELYLRTYMYKYYPNMYICMQVHFIFSKKTCSGSLQNYVAKFPYSY